MSAVDASITALVTLLTMFFVLDWRLTLIAIVPMPFLSWGTGTGMASRSYASGCAASHSSVGGVLRRHTW